MEISCKELACLGRNIPTPFTLLLDAENQVAELTLLEILRIVPGKRLIAIAEWGKETVIAKVFFHPRSWKRNRLRDLRGVNNLRAHHLPAPELIHQTLVKDNQGAVLFFNYLQNGIGLAELFTKNEEFLTDDQEHALKTTVKTLRRCHDVGIWHKDIHLDNVMFANASIYLLDGGDIRNRRHPIGNKHRLDDLAKFISQFPVQMDRRIESILQSYSSNGSGLPADSLRLLTKLVQKFRNKRLDYFERKVFRSTTANRRVKTVSKRFVYDRSLQSDELFQFIDNPDSFIDETKIVKDGDTTTVTEININGKNLILKRYNIIGFWQGLRRLFQISRAHHSWRNASMLLMLGISTPQPYLFMEERRFWLFNRRAYFVSEHIGSDNLQFQLDDPKEKIEDTLLVKRFFELFKTMQEYKISHGDTKVTNFIVRNNELFVLDLDAMKRHTSTLFFHRKAIKDLNRFQRNWANSRFASVFESMINQLRPAGRD